MQQGRIMVVRGAVVCSCTEAFEYDDMGSRRPEPSYLQTVSDDGVCSRCGADAILRCVDCGNPLDGSEIDGGVTVCGSCDQQRRYDAASGYEAVLGQAGYGVRDRESGVWLSDGFDSPNAALGRARQVREAAGEAQQWFWRRVAFLFPQATSGDFAPDAQAEFDRACLRAVAAWTGDNIESETEEETTVQQEQQETVERRDGQQGPSVYLVIGYGQGRASALAFEDGGEIVETVDWNADGSPDWSEAGGCDHRGAGGVEGFRLLGEALTAAERLAGIEGTEVLRVPQETSTPQAPDLDDLAAGEALDEAITEQFGTHPAEEDRERVALGPDWTEELFPAAIGIYPGTRVMLIHDVERYPHFIARAGSLGTVTEQCDLDAIEVRMDDPLPGAEEWGNAIVWYHNNTGDEILRDVAPVDPTPRDRVAGEIQRRIIRSLDDWREGKSASPSELDYVVIARETMQEMWPGFIGTTPEGEQFNADILSDDAGCKYVSTAAIAAFLFETLTAE